MPRIIYFETKNGSFRVVAKIFQHTIGYEYIHRLASSLRFESSLFSILTSQRNGFPAWQVGELRGDMANLKC